MQNREMYIENDKETVGEFVFSAILVVQESPSPLMLM